MEDFSDEEQLPLVHKMADYWAYCRRDDGEKFDLDRKNARSHLNFGYSIHFCIGFQLAKMQFFGIILRELTQRFPNMTLTANQKIEYLNNISFHVPNRVDIDPGLGDNAAGRVSSQASTSSFLPLMQLHPLNMIVSVGNALALAR